MRSGPDPLGNLNLLTEMIMSCVVVTTNVSKKLCKKRVVDSAVKESHNLFEVVLLVLKHLAQQGKHVLVKIKNTTVVW